MQETKLALEKLNNLLMTHNHDRYSSNVGYGLDVFCSWFSSNSRRSLLDWEMNQAAYVISKRIEKLCKDISYSEHVEQQAKFHEVVVLVNSLLRDGNDKGSLSRLEKLQFTIDGDGILGWRVLGVILGLLGGTAAFAGGIVIALIALGFATFPPLVFPLVIFGLVVAVGFVVGGIVLYHTGKPVLYLKTDAIPEEKIDDSLETETPAQTLDEPKPEKISLADDIANFIKARIALTELDRKDQASFLSENKDSYELVDLTAESSVTTNNSMPFTRRNTGVGTNPFGEESKLEQETTPGKGSRSHSSQGGGSTDIPVSYTRDDFLRSVKEGAEKANKNQEKRDLEAKEKQSKHTVSYRSSDRSPTKLKSDTSEIFSTTTPTVTVVVN